jgi:SAM-dependent methyltransferase
VGISVDVEGREEVSDEVREIHKETAQGAGRRPRLRRFLRRYGVALAIIVVAAVAWPVALYELTRYHAPDVPYEFTPDDVVDAMVELAEIQPDDLVFDLGCGDGRLVIAAAKKRGARGLGVDIDPKWVEKAREAAAAAGVTQLVTIRQNDIYRESLNSATVVLMYLMPSVNEALIPQFQHMKPGSRIVSHQFRIPGIKITRRLEVASSQTNLTHPVYLYMTPLEFDN